jgi:hypothetical protein
VMHRGRKVIGTIWSADKKEGILGVVDIGGDIKYYHRYENVDLVEMGVKL